MTVSLMEGVILTNVQTWRQRILAGETLPPEEMREAILAIRKERVGASEKSAGAREKRVTTKEKLAAIDSDKLLNSFF